MVKTFTDFIKQQHLFDTSKEVLLAISGGRDSVAMCELFHQAGYPFVIAHCNFHLRPGDCDRDEQFVRELATRYGVIIHVAQFDTVTDSRSWGCSVEETARKERYSFFENLCENHGYECVATAHHQDDSIETFFINMLRGTGIRGLQGIPIRNGKIIRPMLCFSRADINAFVHREGLEHVEDYTNEDLSFKRNDIRHRLIPLLREMNPSFGRTMMENMARLRDVNQVYEKNIKSIRDNVLRKNEVQIGFPYYTLSYDDIKSLDPQRTMLFEILRPFGFSATIVDSILNTLSQEPGRRFYSDQYRIVLERGFLTIDQKEKTTSDSYSFAVNCDEDKRQSFSFEGCKIEIRFFDIDASTNVDYQEADGIAFFDFGQLRFPLMLRHWKTGDRFSPLGMKGSKLLSDYFKDKKLTTIEKEKVLILCDSDDKIAWVVGQRTDNRFRVTEKTKKVVCIKTY